MKQALVFADRRGDELVPLNEHYSPAMLPVAGHPVLEYTLDRLQSRGIEQVFLIVPAGDNQIRAHFGNGLRWSLDIQYLSARTNDTPDRVRARLGSTLQAPFAALRGDVWRSASTAPQHISNPYCAVTPSGNSQYELWHNLDNSLQALAWQTSATSTPAAKSDDGLFCSLISLSDYHQLAIASADPDWWPASEVRGTLALRSGALSRVHPVCLRDGYACVGDFSLIELGAELRGSNSVGHHCFIARGASLKNAVILDNTFVGAGMRVENAIVIQQRIIRVDLNATLDIQDAFFLAPSRTRVMSKRVYQTFEQLLAGLLLGVGLFAALLVWEPHQNSLGQRQIRHHLWQALIGKLRLFGRPKSSHISDQLASEDYPWLAQFQSIPVGALSPATLAYPQARDPVLLSLAEIELHDSSSLRTLLKHALRAILGTFQHAVNRRQTGESIALTQEVGS